jgi:alpha-galactosidase
VDDIHQMGLKFGLYGCAGTMTCAGYPGSQGRELQDAMTLAAWDVDFWKHDNCYTPCNDSPLPQTCGRPAGNTQEWYARMRDALRDVRNDKNIMFNLCQWGRDNVWTWGDDYGNSWRMSVDNWGDWASVQRIGSAAAGIAQYSGPGGFNDLDMLVRLLPAKGEALRILLRLTRDLDQIVGNGGLTENEERLHFGLWAICKSPLILGNDLNRIPSSTLAIGIRQVPRTQLIFS